MSRSPDITALSGNADWLAADFVPTRHTATHRHAQERIAFLIPLQDPLIGHTEPPRIASPNYLDALAVDRRGNLGTYVYMPPRSP